MTVRSHSVVIHSLQFSRINLYHFSDDEIVEYNLLCFFMGFLANIISLILYLRLKRCVFLRPFIVGAIFILFAIFLGYYPTDSLTFPIYVFGYLIAQLMIRILSKE